MDNFALANRIFDCLSDGYDDEEERETTVSTLTNELKNLSEDSFVKAAVKALCERIEELTD